MIGGCQQPFSHEESLPQSKAGDTRNEMAGRDRFGRFRAQKTRRAMEERHNNKF